MQLIHEEPFLLLNFYTGYSSWLSGSNDYSVFVPVLHYCNYCWLKFYYLALFPISLIMIHFYTPNVLWWSSRWNFESSSFKKNSIGFWLQLQKTDELFWRNTDIINIQIFPPRIIILIPIVPLFLSLWFSSVRSPHSSCPSVSWFCCYVNGFHLLSPPPPLPCTQISEGS